VGFRIPSIASILSLLDLICAWDLNDTTGSPPAIQKTSFWLFLYGVAVYSNVVLIYVHCCIC
jgi:hypothetical protein